MKPLEQKVAIITGSSRGIGAQIAKTIALAGASVVVNYVGNKPAADQVVADIKTGGSDAIALRGDVSSAAEVRSMFDLTITQFGKIDILINNAGSILYKTIQDTTDEDFDRIFAINVKGLSLIHI